MRRALLIESEAIEVEIGNLANNLNCSNTELEIQHSSMLYILNLFYEFPHPLWINDENGRFVCVNKRTVELFGVHTPEDLIGKSYFDLLPEEVAMIKVAEDQSVLKTGNLVVSESQFEINEKKERYITQKYPLYSDGKIFGVCGLSIHSKSDIATEIRSEVSNILSAALNIAPIRFFWKDTNSVYLGCNDAFAHDAGEDKAEDMICKRDSELVWAERSDEYIRDDQEVMTSKTCKIFYEEPHISEGKRIWVRTTKAPVMNSKNDVVGLLGIYTDITAQKSAEEELRISAKAFESQEPTCIMDHHYKVLKINKKYTEVTGYEAHEILGKTPSLLAKDFHTDEFHQQLWEEVHKHGRWLGGMLDWRKTGEIFPVSVLISAVLNNANEITHYVLNFSDISVNKTAQNKIKQLANFDPLTELPNRRILTDRLKQTISWGTKTSNYAALVFIDLDNFKLLNDTLGHQAGDELLKQVAKRLINFLRPENIVSRFWGDEFVILIDKLDDDIQKASIQIKLVAERILFALNVPYKLDQIEYLSTPSIGVTLFRGRECDSHEIILRADIAMYSAKKQGGNRISFFDPSMQEQINAPAQIESELRNAIKCNEFVLLYQTQVDSNGNLSGMEALIRWNHPTRGLLTPIHFITALESTAMIVEVGYWVIKQACLDLLLLEQKYHLESLPVSVNVSPKQFNAPSFVKNIKMILNEHQINPSLIRIELTESTLAENLNEVAIAIKELSDFGVKCSLDDFGTGFSSLQYLKTLPIRQLKIDQSFVRDIEIDKNDQAIIKAIIALSESLGLSVIAEGVENKEQARMLIEYGCKYLQGYLFSKPNTIESISLLSKEQNWHA